GVVGGLEGLGRQRWGLQGATACDDDKLVGGHWSVLLVLVVGSGCPPDGELQRLNRPAVLKVPDEVLGLTGQVCFQAALIGAAQVNPVGVDVRRDTGIQLAERQLDWATRAPALAVGDVLGCHLDGRRRSHHWASFPFVAHSRSTSKSAGSRPRRGLTKCSRDEPACSLMTYA